MPVGWKGVMAGADAVGEWVTHEGQHVTGHVGGGHAGDAGCDRMLVPGRRAKPRRCGADRQHQGFSGWRGGRRAAGGDHRPRCAASGRQRGRCRGGDGLRPLRHLADARRARSERGVPRVFACRVSTGWWRARGGDVLGCGPGQSWQCGSSRRSADAGARAVRVAGAARRAGDGGGDRAGRAIGAIRRSRLARPGARSRSGGGTARGRSIRA